MSAGLISRTVSSSRLIQPTSTAVHKPSLSLYDLIGGITQAVKYYRKTTAAASHYGKDFTSDGLLRLHRLLHSYNASLNEWRRYAFFDPNKLYTRNLIATDRSSFTLMLLCWNAMQSSPVHDHAESECFMRVLEGSIVETQYRSPNFTDDSDAPLQDMTDYQPIDAPVMPAVPSAPSLFPSHLIEKRRVVAGRGSVLYINDEIGIHKVESPERSVSLHLYVPGYNQCDVYNETTSSRHKAAVSFYSKHGYITEPSEPVHIVTNNQTMLR